jgi:hypothetical protein
MVHVFMDVLLDFFVMVAQDIDDDKGISVDVDVLDGNGAQDKAAKMPTKPWMASRMQHHTDQNQREASMIKPETSCFISLYLR